MAQFIGNPSDYSDRACRVVPFCPARAEVIQSPPLALFDRGVYMLRRYDWDTYDRKSQLARQLYSAPLGVHTPVTLHDYATGHLAPPTPGPKFGVSPDALTADLRARDRVQDKKFRAQRQADRLREVLEGGAADDDADWAHAFSNLYHDTKGYSNQQRILIHVEGKLGRTAHECAKCSAPAFYLQSVYTARRYVSDWCNTCVEERAGTYGDDYYATDILVHIHDEDTHVPDWVADSDYFEHSNGDWYSEPEECDDDDDDDGGSTAELHNYHSTKGRLRGWTMAPDGQPLISTGCWAPMTIGIELEVESKKYRPHTVAPLVYSLRDIIGDESLFAEKDGSLDADKGFELIFGWSDLSSWQRAMPRIGTALKEGEVISHDAGINYGLHVNVAVTNNIIVQGAITWFINNNDNAKLLFSLARRAPTPFCPRLPGQYYPTNSHNAAVNFGNTAGVFKTDTSGKLVDCDSTIASFRLFRGTINPVRLMADIEFCHSLVSAATAYSYQFNLGDGLLCSMHFSGFTMRYWQTHVLKNITRYPTLVNYLRHWDKKQSQPTNTRRHGAFTDRAMTRFISQYPMGTLTGATHDGLDKRALALLNHTIASTEE